ncbi:MAG: exodeoxyribonuclease VII small subunit [Actinobacteria bacterium]|nr:exodeoxyribonuclease VII small subunit [Actinomycetota bacterium]
MNKSFEKAMKRLEEIASLLEDGSQTLEGSLKLFEEANELAGFCEEKLDTAEKKLKILTKNGKEFKIQEEMF